MADLITTGRNRGRGKSSLVAHEIDVVLDITNKWFSRGMPFLQTPQKAQPDRGGMDEQKPRAAGLVRALTSEKSNPMVNRKRDFLVRY
jgi:hypothetical protein